MKKACAATAGAVLAALLAAGCSSVCTPQPLGAAPYPVDRGIEGTWRVGDSLLAVRFASNGVARIAGLEWKDDRFRVREGEAVVAEGKTRRFLSVRFREDGTWPERYGLLQYAPAGPGELVLWAPDPERFRAAVTSGLLEGFVEKTNRFLRVTLTHAPDALLAFIDRPDAPPLFQYEKPMVLRAVAGSE